MIWLIKLRSLYLKKQVVFTSIRFWLRLCEYITSIADVIWFILDGFKHSTGEYLKKMSTMIRDINVINFPTKKYQVHVVLRVLPKSWDIMKLNVMPNESNTSITQLSCHLELKEDRHWSKTDMWLCLVSTIYLGLSVSNMTKHITVEKLNL